MIDSRSLRAREGAVESPRPDASTWRMPPDPDNAPVMGAASEGGRISLTVPSMDRPMQRAVVVLWAREDGWSVLSPRFQAEEVRVSDLEPQEAGLLALEVPVPGPPGRCRLAVAFPVAEAVRWELPEEVRWDDVQRAVADGEVPLTYFRLHVVPS